MNVKQLYWLVVALTLLELTSSRRKNKSKCEGQYRCKRSIVPGHSKRRTCIEKSQLCNRENDCPNADDEEGCLHVDGAWADWLSWSGCDGVTCGVGSRVRYRTCTNPAPTGNGGGCIGNVAEASLCLMKDCPVNGNWGNWMEWSKCSVTCDGGTRKRTRTCTCPAPSGGGNYCDGDKEKIEECATKGCPVNGGWTEWLDRPCVGDACYEKTTKSRYRFCEEPRPSNGGDYCPGDHLFSYKCSAEFLSCKP